MSVAALHEERKAPTFEEVWALLREVGEKQKETAEQLRETDRQLQETAVQMREQQKETAEQMRETDRRVEEQWKKTNKVIGDLGLRLGEIVERLIAPNLVEKFNVMGFNLTTAGPNQKFYDNKHRELAEVDVLLENSNLVIAVEAKSKLLASHIQDHIERMNILRAYADEHNDQRVWLGAVGGAVLAPDARKAALKAGFYLLEQAGDTMMISVPEGFKPKEWTFRMVPQQDKEQA
ncbi:MAG: hypothetical protein LBJ41_12295 [Treponema sp.]|jgi:hypothetical protein|nr:hypothetical protein [Treponema sp.]